jgi:hypothetical protein
MVLVAARRVGSASAWDYGTRTTLHHVTINLSAHFWLDGLELYVREGCSFGLEPEVPWGAQDGVRHGAQALERPLEEITHFVKRNLETRLVQTIGEENEVDTIVCSAPAIFGHVKR